MSDIKRGVGRPPKTDSSNPESIIKRINEQMDKFSAKTADNLHNLLGTIYDTATSTNKSVGIKDKVAAAKYCIEFSEKYLKLHSTLDTGKFVPGEEEKEKTYGELISMTSKKSE